MTNPNPSLSAIDAHHERSVLFYVVLYIALGLGTTGVLEAIHFSDFTRLQVAIKAAFHGDYSFPQDQAISPAVFFLFSPLALLPTGIQGAVFTLGGIVALVASLIIYRRESSDVRKMNRLLECGIIVGSAPLLESLVIGQEQTWYLALMVLFVALRSTKPQLAGAALGLAVLFRFQMVIFIPCLVLGCRRNIYKGLGLTVGIAWLTTILFFGTRIWSGFFNAIPTTLIATFGGPNSQSLFALVELFEGNSRFFSLALIVILLVVVLVSCVVSCKDAARDELRVSLLMLVSMVVPSAVWYHSFALLPLALLPLLRAQVSPSWRSRASMVVLYTFLLIVQVDRQSGLLSQSHGIILRLGILCLALCVGIRLIQKNENTLAAVIPTSPSGAPFLLAGFLVVGGGLFYELYKALFGMWVRGYIFDADSYVYAAVGQGLLNSQNLYTDLYNNKGPGLAWISALCMMRPGGILSCAVLQQVNLALSALAIIPIFALKPFNYLRTIPLVALALGVGFLLMLVNYAAATSVGFQAESIALAPAILFTLLILKPPSSRILTHLVLGILVAATVSVKEPVALALVASALVVMKSLRDLIDWVIIPFLYAALILVTLLLLSGTFQPYFKIYLNDVFVNLIWRDGSSSAWGRGFGLAHLVSSHREFSPSFALLIMTTWLFAGVTIYLRRGLSVKGVFGFFVSLYLIRFCVGIGSTYWGHHFVMAIPFYIACYHQWMTTLSWDKNSVLYPVALAVSGALFCSASAQTPIGTGRDISSFQLIQEEAKRIDAILDQCGWSTYGFVGGIGEQPYAFTEHSPVGPLFFQIWDNQSTDLTAEWFPRLLSSPMIVMEAVDLSLIEPSLRVKGALQEAIPRSFGSSPPKCMDGISLKGSRYRFLFKLTS